MPADVIARTVHAAAEAGAAVAALRATDTVKRGNAGGFVRETLPREQVFLAQTPQAFRPASAACRAGHRPATPRDEAMLAERAGPSGAAWSKGSRAT